MFVVIGTTTVDLFVSGMNTMPRFDGDEFTSSSLVFCDQPLTMTLGGNGANSAYVLASLGAKTALCSAAGQDDLGGIVVGWLAAKGVDLRGFQRRSDAGTPTTIALVDRSLNRLSFHHPGPSVDFAFDDIPSDLLDEARVVLLTSYPLLNRFRPDGFAAVLKRAKQNGAMTALDIGPLLGDPVTLGELQPFLNDVDYLFANQREMASCGGAEALIANGARQVVIKCGEEGARLYSPGKQTPVKGFPVEARVTIGAGDSFNAGFLFAVEQGMSPEEAARFGNAAASLVVQSGKSVLGSPTRGQVEDLMNGAK